MDNLGKKKVPPDVFSESQANQTTIKLKHEAVFQEPRKPNSETDKPIEAHGDPASIESKTELWEPKEHVPDNDSQTGGREETLEMKASEHEANQSDRKNGQQICQNIISRWFDDIITKIIMDHHGHAAKVRQVKQVNR